ncbi:MAG: hypothetical protein MZV63_29885 [Marinilabiliales bacterium]|nr:hypothetical protein [Marinilabiliales bacterium]
MRLLFILLVIIALNSCAGTRRQAAITHGELTQIAGRLASDEFSGRGTGTGGDSLAALCIRDEFRKAGLTPFTGSGLQPFRVNVAVETGERNRLIINGSEYLRGTDFVPLALTSNSRPQCTCSLLRIRFHVFKRLIAME